MLLAFATFVGLGGDDIPKTIISIMLGLVCASIGFDVIEGEPRLQFFDLVGFSRPINFLVLAIGVYGVGEMLWTLHTTRGDSEMSEGRCQLSRRSSSRDRQDLPRGLARHIDRLVAWLLRRHPAGGGGDAGLADVLWRREDDLAEARGVRQGLGRRGGGARGREQLGLDRRDAADDDAGDPGLADDGGAADGSGAAGTRAWAASLRGSAGLRLAGDRVVLHLEPDRGDREPGVHSAVPLDARMPFTILAPIIFVLSTAGVYAATDSMFDVWLMFWFGLGAFLLRILQYPLAPAALAIVLGSITEQKLRQSLQWSNGDLGDLLQPLVRPRRAMARPGGSRRSLPGSPWSCCCCRCSTWSSANC